MPFEGKRRRRRRRKKSSSSSSPLIDVSSLSSCVAERMCSWLRESTNPRRLYFFIFFFPGPCETFKKWEWDSRPARFHPYSYTYSLCVCVYVCVWNVIWRREELAAMKGLERRSGSSLLLITSRRPRLYTHVVVLTFLGHGSSSSKAFSFFSFFFFFFSCVFLESFLKRSIAHARWPLSCPSTTLHTRSSTRLERVPDGGLFSNPPVA